MKIRIYDYANNAVNIEIPDKPIKRIHVRILTGDETGTILFEDGTQLGFDASVEPVLKGDSRLPSGYTELEYIESSGTQYVDTGVVPNNKGGVHYIDKNRIEAAVKTLRRQAERGEDR